ncbi:hypothetical protein LPJ61_002055 [Coemansia biformis]|uniref:WD40 repeat-like protein n=1 Tax=Coemansia biformis TaxID=1286918 RepID=A0A9W7YFQ6_9FUNG|nr:hypothetical protein LPJ61_002055 [Coemansia biformis]
MAEHKRKASAASPAGAGHGQRKQPAQGTAVALAKRPKTDVGPPGESTAVVPAGPKRTSGLQAPIMHLTGHAGEVTSCQFSDSGEHVASGSADMRVFLWNTYGECANYGVLQGHKGGVLEVQWMAGGERLITASVDKTVAVWDAATGERLKRGRRHTAAVNSCCPLSKGAGDDSTFTSASDDGTILLWDARERHPVAAIEHGLPLTSVVSATNSMIYAGSLDNAVTCWDIRTLAATHTLRGHSDTVMGLAISPSTSRYLASTSLDNTVRLWDLRPYCRLANRCERVLSGVPHGFDMSLIRPAFDAAEELVASGSADRTLTIWNVRSGEIKYKLPGHKGCVTQAGFHPKEPIVLSGSADKTLFLGEL